MKDIKPFQYNAEQLQELANQIKDMLAEAAGLEDELSDYLITFASTKTFGKYFEKHFPDEDTGPNLYHFIVTKSTEVKD